MISITICNKKHSNSFTKENSLLSWFITVLLLCIFSILTKVPSDIWQKRSFSYFILISSPSNNEDYECMSKEKATILKLNFEFVYSGRYILKDCI